MEVIEKICRVCRNIKGIFSFSLKMIDTEYGELTFGDCFEIVTKIEAASCNQQTQYFCSQCASELRRSYTFILKALESEEEFRRIPLEGNFEYDEAVGREEQSQNNPTDIKVDLEIDAKMCETHIRKETIAVSNTLNLEKQHQHNTTKQLLKGCKYDKEFRQTFVGNVEYAEVVNNEEHNADKFEEEIGFVAKNSKQIELRNKTFQDRCGLRQHERIHVKNRGRNFAFYKCKKKLYTKRNFQTHLKTHDVNRRTIFKCDECDKSFFHNYTLKLHKQEHSGCLIKCRFCQKRYKRPIDLKIHLLSNHKGYRLKCDICEKEYVHYSSLMNRWRQNTSLLFKCSNCSKGFEKKTGIHRHIRGVHKLKDKELQTHDVNRKTIFQCDECDESFPHNYALKLHKQIHSRNVRKCRICLKRYKRLSDLKIHLRDKHEGYRHKCDICETEYVHHSSLIMPLRQHTCLFFKCSTCTKDFEKNSGIRGVHKLEDKELKTRDLNRKTIFQCDECDESFPYNYSLKLHKQIHTRNIMKCRICQKLYKSVIGLKIHLRGKHEGYHHKCDICAKEYVHYSSLMNLLRQNSCFLLKCSNCSGLEKKTGRRRHIGAVFKSKDIELMNKLLI